MKTNHPLSQKENPNKMNGSATIQYCILFFHSNQCLQAVGSFSFSRWKKTFLTFPLSTAPNRDGIPLKVSSIRNSLSLARTHTLTPKNTIYNYYLCLRVTCNLYWGASDQSTSPSPPQFNYITKLLAYFNTWQTFQLIFCKQNPKLLAKTDPSTKIHYEILILQHVLKNQYIKDILTKFRS